ncbi:hypothetical protein QTP70_001254, partial [Hemibagrus guttatus]
MSEFGVEELDCPAQCPDLNPIQHLWDELERRLRARPSRPTSVPDLTNSLVEERSKIPINTLLNLVESLPRRVEAVIAAKGGTTPYYIHVQEGPARLSKKPENFCMFHFYFLHLLSTGTKKECSGSGRVRQFRMVQHSTRSSLSTEKLGLLGINTPLCNWILDFLTGRPQSVRIGNSTSSTTTLNTGAPQGCVLSPLLFTLLTHDCAAMRSWNHIVKFADDTTVVGLINKNDESAYREEVQRLTAWCKADNLSLNVEKTKEMVVDFRKAQSDHSPLEIDGSDVEIVKSTKFCGVHLAEDLTWSLNTSSITKKAQQRLYFLRRLRKAHLPPLILTTFYRRTIESILSSCITSCFGNCTVSDHKTLQRIVRTAEKIIGVSLPSITEIYSTCCIRKANCI